MTPFAIPPTMKAPSDRRPGIWRQGVLQIWVTRSCDKACFGCTQGSNLAGRPGRITVDQFRDACRSLRGYFGVVGMFGGNPCVHPQFDELCAVMREEVPFEQRGLWSNKLFGHGATCRETFNPAYSNLNVHQDREAYDEMVRDWPEAAYKVKGHDTDSRHSPVYVAMKDVVSDEAERWRLIASCDINQFWSAMIGVFRGELRAWFCEIAGAMSMLHQHEPGYPDTGLRVEPDWWRQPMSAYDAQVRKHCHECGIPLRGYGALANGDASEREQVSETHVGIFKTKRQGRPIELVVKREQLSEQSLVKATDYIENGSR